MLYLMVHSHKGIQRKINDTFTFICEFAMARRAHKKLETIQHYPAV